MNYIAFLKKGIILFIVQVSHTFTHNVFWMLEFLRFTLCDICIVKCKKKKKIVDGAMANVQALP